MLLIATWLTKELKQTIKTQTSKQQTNKQTTHTLLLKIAFWNFLRHVRGCMLISQKLVWILKIDCSFLLRWGDYFNIFFRRAFKFNFEKAFLQFLSSLSLWYVVLISSWVFQKFQKLCYLVEQAIKGYFLSVNFLHCALRERKSEGGFHQIPLYHSGVWVCLYVLGLSVIMVACLQSKTESLLRSLRCNGILDLPQNIIQSCPQLIWRHHSEFRRNRNQARDDDCRCVKGIYPFGTRSLPCNWRTHFPGCWQARTFGICLSLSVCPWWCQSIQMRFSSNLYIPCRPCCIGK